ncbi:MAG: DnaD domain protein [Fusobacteria bacterium]|nr:DnaD domain protein [Fusobacteriota bacterium]
MSNNSEYQQKLKKILSIEYTSIPSFFFQKIKELKLSLEEGFVLLELWHLIFTEKKNVSDNSLAEVLNIDEEKVLEILSNLISKNLVTYVESDGVFYYDFDSFIDSMFDDETDINKEGTDKELVFSETSKKVKNTKKEAKVYQAFEGEFKKALSPIEVDFIDEWLNERGYSEDMLMEVLKLAVSSSKLNFKYIDKVLLDWEQKGVSTQLENNALTKEIKKKSASNSKSKIKRTAKPGKYDDLYE